MATVALAAFAAYSAYSSKAGQRNQMNAQAGIEDSEANLARSQANAQEGDVRNAGREALGRQIGAFGAAGVAGGASTIGAESQSAVYQELDALRTRYKGAVVAYGYKQQSYLDRLGASALNKQAGLSAAAALLKSSSSSYTGLSKDPLPVAPGQGGASPSTGPN